MQESLVPTAWSRPRLSLGGPPAQVLLVALTDAQLPDPLPVSRSRHGLPASATAGEATLCVRDRAEHAAYFADLAGSALLELVADELGPAAAAAARTAGRAYQIEAVLDDPSDLGYLQAAWALARCVADEAAAAGAATVVIDVLAGRAWTGDAVRAEDPHRALDPTREVSIVVEDGAPSPDAPPAATATVFTRGLRKLGRADLVVPGVEPTTVAEVASLLRSLVVALAEGDLLEVGDVLELPDAAPYQVTALAPEAADALGLAADALALTR
ncbi:MAG: hypothetical protein R2939_05760 [Kofleriaceae bacterium]